MSLNALIDAHLEQIAACSQTISELKYIHAPIAQSVFMSNANQYVALRSQRSLQMHYCGNMISLR